MNRKHDPANPKPLVGYCPTIEEMENDPQYQGMRGEHQAGMAISGILLLLVAATVLFWPAFFISIWLGWVT